MAEPKVYRRQTISTPALRDDAQIIYIPVDKIRPNRAQPRHRFDNNTMIRLADSVRRYGILQPLTVREVPITETDGAPDRLPYELISGERRLRAAKLAGITQVPCILTRVDDHLSAELALVENILREDLNMFEQAAALGRLILRFSLTQEEVARKMSMSQSAVANKLRLLRLTEEEQRKILAAGLSERHARTLLRIGEESARKKALDHIIEKQMNVAASEQYIDTVKEAMKNGVKSVLMPQTVSDAENGTEKDPFTEDGTQNGSASENETPKRRKLIIKDLKIFMNSIEHACSILDQTELCPKIERFETDGRVVIQITVNHPSAEQEKGSVARVDQERLKS